MGNKISFNRQNDAFRSFVQLYFKNFKSKETLFNKENSYPKLRPYFSASGTETHFSLGLHFVILIRSETIDLLDGSCQGQIVHNSNSGFG